MDKLSNIISRIFKRRSAIALVAACMIFVPAGYVLAQPATDQPVQAQPDLVPEATPEAIPEAMPNEDEFGIDNLPSLLFTYWEKLEIDEAQKSALTTQGQPVARVVSRSSNATKEPVPKPPPEKRYIHLQGILFTSDNDWVVWMNGKKVSPNALPEEAIGFKVYKDYVEMKWFDDYTNQIIPVRIRPMQRFNIDTRIFLPG